MKGIQVVFKHSIRENLARLLEEVDPNIYQFTNMWAASGSKEAI